MKIFFLGPLNSTFVKNDIYILNQKHTLLTENSSIGKKFKGIVNLFTITFRSIYKTMKADAVYCWFADYTTLIPVVLAKLLGKKAYVVAGGFDVCYIPEMNYGAKARKFRWFCVRMTFKYCYKIFPVSNYALDMLIKQTEKKYSQAIVIYNAVNTEELIKLKPNKIERKYILTVSGTYSNIEFYIKGLDRFIKLAERIPEKKFVIAGLISDALSIAKKQSENIPNIQIIPGPLSFIEELVPLYYNSSAYLQLSIDESFGMAVVESMACGSMPIVSPNGALPELVKDGSYIARNDSEVIHLIEKSFDLNEEERMLFVEHSKNFDIKIREKNLLSLIEGELRPHSLTASKNRDTV